MRIAVLGSTSFAGGDFVDLLLDTERFEVLGISRSPQKAAAFVPFARRPQARFRYRQLDLNGDVERIVAELDAFAPDYVVNFAAQGDDAASWLYPADFFATNCVALSRLVDALKDRPGIRRFLHVSSSGVYGNPPETITEATPLAPLSPYAVSKAAADLLLLAYHRSCGFPVQIVRPPNLYGAYQQLFRIIPKSIVGLRRGRPIELHGGGRAMRAYLHVRDASRAMLAMLESAAPGTVYNIAPDALCSVGELARLICGVMGADEAASIRAVPDRRAQSSVAGYDASAIRADLGWRPRVSLRAGIEATRDWIDREWESLMADQLEYTHTR